MELISNLGENSGALGVRWCLSEADANNVKDRGLVGLTVVIDVFYNPDQERTRDRIVVSASQYMRFVTFRHPGIVRVCAMLVGFPATLSENGRRQQHNLLTKISNGYYELRAFDFSRDWQRDDNEVWGYRTEASSDTRSVSFEGKVVSVHSIDIDVPESYFAKPWPAPVDRWVTWVPRALLRRKLWDECDRRRWAMFAFTIQPIFYVAYFVVMSLLLGVAYLSYWMIVAYVVFWRGYRGISLDELPLPHNVMGTAVPTELAKQAGWSSFYLHDKNGNWLPKWRQWLQPAGICVAVALGTFLYLEPSDPRNIYAFGLLTLGFLGMLPSVRYQATGYDYRTGGQAKKQIKAQREAVEQQAEQARSLEWPWSSLVR